MLRGMCVSRTSCCKAELCPTLYFDILLVFTFLSVLFIAQIALCRVASGSMAEGFVEVGKL